MRQLKKSVLDKEQGREEVSWAMNHSLQRELIKFVEDLCQYAECPESWPLSPTEQQCFVRGTLLMALRIKRSPDFQYARISQSLRECTDSLSKPTKKK